MVNKPPLFNLIMFARKLVMFGVGATVMGTGVAVATVVRTRRRGGGDGGGGDGGEGGDVETPTPPPQHYTLSHPVFQEHNVVAVALHRLNDLVVTPDHARVLTSLVWHVVAVLTTPLPPTTKQLRMAETSMHHIKHALTTVVNGVKSRTSAALQSGGVGVGGDADDDVVAIAETITTTCENVLFNLHQAFTP